MYFVKFKFETLVCSYVIATPANSSYHLECVLKYTGVIDDDVGTDQSFILPNRYNFIY